MCVWGGGGGGAAALMCLVFQKLSTLPPCLKLHVMEVKGHKASCLVAKQTVEFIVGVKLKFPFTGCLRTVHWLNGNSSVVCSVYTQQIN